jgi:hypothetical protein
MPIVLSSQRICVKNSVPLYAERETWPLRCRSLLLALASAHIVLESVVVVRT